MNKKHNYQIGKINFCQICNSKQIKMVMDFGYQPLADDLIPLKMGFRKTLFYPLKIYLCKKCSLLQTSYIVGDNTLYPKNYHYLPGISKTVVDNFASMASNLKKIYDLQTNDLIIDVGCNDGSLLNEFKKINLSNVLGIDPTDTIKIASQKKIQTIQNFFNLRTASIALKKYGKAKIITTTNVFAHTNKLGDFILAAKKMLKKDGTFVIENHYLLDVIKLNQFDTFYHEHLRTYSLKSLVILLKYYGFHLKDAYTSDRYGGNIQAHFSLKKNKYNKRIKAILLKEEKFKLNNESTYSNFFNKIYIARDQMYKFLTKYKHKNIVGKAFPARASVILHFFSFMKDHLKCIYEQPSSNKINHYAPGTDVKILSSKTLLKNKPDIMIILAWHMFDEIKNKWKNKGLKNTKFIKPLPFLRKEN